MKSRILAISILSIITLGLFFPIHFIPLAHAATGTVCIAPVSDSTGAATTSCSTAPSPVFNGPVTSPVNSQLRVAVFIEGSDSLLGFDVTLSTDPAILQPADADITGTILLGSLTVLGKCIQGTAVAGGCGPGASANVTTLEFAVVGGGGLTVQPITGLLFTAIYNVVGTGTTTINFAHNAGCTPSSGTGADAFACVTISNGTGSPPSETLQTGSFNNGVAPAFATYDAPSITSLTTLAPVSGTGSHALTASLSAQGGFGTSCQSPPSSFDTCTVSFSSSVQGPSSGITVTNPTPTSLSGAADATPVSISSPIIVASSTTTGTYTVVVTATYQTQNSVTSLVSTISESITVTVTIQDFTFTVSPTTVPFWTTQTGTTTVTVAPVNGFNSGVALTSVVTPTSPTPPTPALTASFSPTSITGSGTSTLSFAAGTIGAYSVSVRGTAVVGGQSKQRSVSVTVNEQDFNITSDTASVTFQSGNTGTATLTLGSLPSGSLSIHGFTGNLALTSSATPSTPVLGITFSPNTVSLASGQKSTATVTFSSSAITLTTYTVTITGTATLSTSTPGTQAHSITITVTVTPPGNLPDFNITSTPSTVNVNAGTSGTSTIKVASINSFTGTINLTASISPATGLTCSFNPTSITLGTSGTSTLTCNGLVGQYTVTVTGTDPVSSTSHSTILTFTIQDFLISASPTTVFIAAVTGDTGTSTITVSPVLGFTGNVTLSQTSSPSGLTCSLSPASILLGGSGTSTLSCRVVTGGPGNYTVTVTGTNGTLAHATVVTFKAGAIICLVDTTATTCPAAPATLTGTPGSQLRVPVFVKDSPSLLGFDIILKVNSTVLRPADADITGSILPGTKIIVSKCIAGVAVEGACDPNALNHADTLEFGVVAGLTTAPTNGLLFTAVFNILTTTSEPTTIDFQTGCSPSSRGALCINISDGTATPVPMSFVLVANFDNAVTNFRITLNPASAPQATPGTSATSTITVTAISPFAGTVTLTIVTSPAGFTPTISPTSIDLSTSASGTATLTVNLSGTLTPGLYNVTIQGSGGGQVTRVTFNITITSSAIHDVAIVSFTVSPTSATVAAGDQVTFSIIVKNKGTLNETVTVNALANNITVATGSFTILAGQSQTVTLYWNTTGYGPTSGTGTMTYQLGAQVARLPSETNTGDNTQLSGTIAVAPPASTGGLTTLLIIIGVIAIVVIVVAVLLLRRRRPAQTL